MRHTIKFFSTIAKKKAIRRIIFPPAAKSKLLNSFEELKGVNPYVKYNEIRFDLAASLHKSLIETNASEVLKIFETMRSERRLSKVAVLSNFPSDLRSHLNATPPRRTFFNPLDPECIGKTGFFAEYAMIAAMTYMGCVLPAKQDLQNYSPIHHVCIKEGKEETPSHAGRAHFPPHTDGAHNEYNKMINWILLLSLRNRVTESVFIPLYKLEIHLKQILGSNFEVLTQPYFIFSSSRAYDKTSELKAPIVYLDEEGKVARWRIQTNMDLVKADPEQPLAKHCLKLISEFLLNPDNQDTTILKHDDCALIDNFTQAHTRRGISEKDNDRHLLRAHGVFDKPTLERVVKKISANELNPKPSS